MEKYHQGKYFTFFNIRSNDMQVVQYKRKEEEFYAANTIWDARIISNLFYDIKLDDKVMATRTAEPVSDKVDILFLENSYILGKSVQFMVLNKEYEKLDMAYMVLDKDGNFEGEFPTDSKFTPYKDLPEEMLADVNRVTEIIKSGQGQGQPEKPRRKK